MEGLEQINYTIIEPTNDYYSDIYSPGQTKLQLEIGQEVSPSKVKIGSEYLEAGIHTVKTRSKNMTLEVTAIRTVTENGVDIEQISTGYLVGSIYNQRAVRHTGTMRKNRIYYFSAANKGKILKLFPGGFVIEVEGSPVTLSYRAYNVTMGLDKLPQDD